jgi:ceramide glucosyltransferase
VLFCIFLATLAGLSFCLTLWQWFVARRFPLHQRATQTAFAPPVTLLKPLKGSDAYSEACLRSWFEQDYAGEIQILFAVSSAGDAVAAIVNQLIAEFPDVEARLVVCPDRRGANAKVSKLAQLEPEMRHELVLVSDADVRVPPDFLANLVQPMRDESVGLVHCFYRLANAATVAMRWEAVAINADFWSQVLQSRSLKSMDFALGAAMLTRRSRLRQIGGFQALVDCLADDYQLGHRLAARGDRIELCPVVVECWDAPVGWRAVWRHQLRWARTIRVCQPGPYFASILSNPLLWPLLWLAFCPQPWVFAAVTVALAVRLGSAMDLQGRLTQKWDGLFWLWLVPVKDLLQVLLWLAAFLGNVVEWRGERYLLKPDGNLERISAR